MRIQINARNRAHHFDAAQDQSVLHAGLSCALTLPYECGSGTCGTCRAKLISGEITDGWPEAPGRKFLKGADEFLMCQCMARSAVSIEVASFVEDADPATCVPVPTRGHIRRALGPAPSTRRQAPEMNAAAGDSRNSTAAETSLSVPSLRRGIVFAAARMIGRCSGG